MVKWYNIYNAPGGPSAHAEWSLFVTCLMTLMGYNTERLAWTRNVSELLMDFFREQIRDAAVISYSAQWTCRDLIMHWLNLNWLSWVSPRPPCLSSAAVRGASLSGDCSQEGSSIWRRLWWGAWAAAAVFLRIWRRRRSKSGSIPAQFYTVIGGEWRPWGRFKGRHFITAASGRDEGFQMVEILLKILPVERRSVQRWSLSYTGNEGEAFINPTLGTLASLQQWVQ